jgi:hypothetical protein
MGGAASVDGTPQQWTAEQIAGRMKALGPDFVVYADNYLACCTNGCQSPTAPKDLEEFGVISPDHQARIMAELHNLTSSNPLKFGRSKQQSSHKNRLAFFRNPFWNNTHSCVNEDEPPKCAPNGRRTDLEKQATTNKINDNVANKHEPAEQIDPMHASSQDERNADDNIAPPNIPLAIDPLPNTDRLVFLSYARGDIATPFTMWLCKTLQVSTLSSASGVSINLLLALHRRMVYIAGWTVREYQVGATGRLQSVLSSCKLFVQFHGQKHKLVTIFFF